MNIHTRIVMLGAVFSAVVASSKVAGFPSRFRTFPQYYDGPSFCKGLECPLFNKTDDGDGYEIRRYVAAKWVSTNVMGMDYDSASSVGFSRLFDYISGANEDKIKIDMTAPVINRVIPGQGPTCENNFTISFFIPFALQSNPPAPTNSDVFLSELPEQTVYVGSFGGFASQEDWIKAADQLNQQLAATSYKYTAEHFYTAGYDSPFQLFRRHNEVWFVGQE